QAVDPLAGLAEMIKRCGLSLSKSVAEPFAGLRAHAHSPVSDWVGECSTSSFLPPPRYMCTPHGRQGSKLRTVRITSMPLKCSRSLSSKIGWPCTASSYGPGVPKESRGLAFQGVGGYVW